IAVDVAALDCAAEIKHLHTIAVHGTSADRQVEIFGKARISGRRRLTALKEVVDWAAAETRVSNDKAWSCPGYQPVTHAGFPLSSRPPIKPHTFQGRRPCAGRGDEWQRRSTSSMDRI